jgi:hypothetical protein
MKNDWLNVYPPTKTSLKWENTYEY